MAKDRANDPKRKFDTSAMSKMGAALGYGRSTYVTSDSGAEGISARQSDGLGTHGRTVKSSVKDTREDNFADIRTIPGKGHAKLRNPGYGKADGKYDSEGNTDEWRERNNANDAEDTKKYNERNPSTVVKISSDPAKGK